MGSTTIASMALPMALLVASPVADGAVLQQATAAHSLHDHRPSCSYGTCFDLGIEVYNNA